MKTGSEQNAAANRAFHLTQFFQGQFAVGLVDIDNHIADVFLGLQVLAAHVDAVLGEHLVDFGHHAGHVLVNVQQAVLVRVRRQCHFREVHRRNGGTVVAVHSQLLGHFTADVFLGFDGGATHVRGQDAVVEFAQRRYKLFIVGLRLNREYVDCCPQQFAGTQRIGQGVDIHHGTAGSVHQDATRLHLCKLLGLEHVFGRRSFRYVQGNHIGNVQQFLQRAHLRGVTDRQLGNHVVEIHVHAQALGQSVDIHHGTAGSVHQDATRLHLCKLLGLEHVFGRRSFRYVQGNHIGNVQQFLQRAHLRGVTDRQLGNHVVEIHVHAQALGQDTELGADVAVSDDTQLLATDFVAVLGGLDPLTPMRLGALLGHATQQQDGLGQNQLGYGTGVGERCVENGNTTAGCSLQVYLVGANAETAHSHQLLGGFKYFLGQLGARPDTDEVRIGNLLDQVFLAQ